MEWDAFRARVSQLKKQNPVWFGLESDPPASEHAIALAETALGVILPQSYRQFVREFGGGYFAFASVFSVEPGSDWNVVDRNRDRAGGGFVRVSDSGCGDYYGFMASGGECEERIHLADHEARGQVRATEYRDLFELLAAVALKLK
jgi:hypothetical protein